MYRARACRLLATGGPLFLSAVAAKTTRAYYRLTMSGQSGSQISCSDAMRNRRMRQPDSVTLCQAGERRGPGQAGFSE